jgi:hypothetical protein
MIYKTIACLAALMVSSVTGKVYFQESFGNGWEDRWVESTAKPAVSYLYFIVIRIIIIIYILMY